MIISVNDTNRFQPSDNPIMLSWTSNRANIHYYRVRVYISPNNIDAPTLLLNSLQIYPIPGGDFKTAELNLSALLKDYVQPQFKYDSSSSLANGFQVHPENIRGYKIEIDEYYISNARITKGDSSVSGTKYIFKSKIDQVSFATYLEKALYLDYNEIVNPTGAPKTRFMTTYKGIKPVYKGYDEFVYFLSDTPMTYLFLEVTVRWKDGTSVTFNKYANINEGGGYRLRVNRMNVSPSFLFDEVDLENLVTYSVVLKNKIFGSVTTSRELTNKLEYRLEELLCNQKGLQYFFMNQFGCFEPIVLTNNKDSFSMNKISIMVNNLRRNKYGGITEWNDFHDNENEAMIFNQENRDLSIEFQMRQELSSIKQSDEYRNWYKGIHFSTRIYFQLTDEIFIPCRSLSTSFDNQLNRYNLKDANQRFRILILEFDSNFQSDFIDFAKDSSPTPPSTISVIGYLANYI